MDTADETTTARARLGTWIFVSSSALTVAALRLQGARGENSRAAVMRELSKVYTRGSITMFLHSRNGSIEGVAARGPEGDIVAVYYGPGDSRNTRLDWEGYSLQHRLVEPEALIPIRRAASNDLSDNAYMPLAARDTRRNQ